MFKRWGNCMALGVNDDGRLLFPQACDIIGMSLPLCQFCNTFRKPKNPLVDKNGHPPFLTQYQIFGSIDYCHKRADSINWKLTANSV